MGCDFLNEMECDFFNEGKKPPTKFNAYGSKKDGLDIYENVTNHSCIFFNSDKFICPLCKANLPEDEIKKIKSLKRNDVNFFSFIKYYTADETLSDKKQKLEEFEKKIEEEEKYLQTLYYKHKCNKTNQEIYLRLYPSPGPFKQYIINSREIYFNYRELRNKCLGRQYKTPKKEKITKDGYFKGKRLCGKVQVVDVNPDFKVQVVEYLPDLKVQKVDNFPHYIGEWQFVDWLPDFKIQYVDLAPDFKIQFVENFPGLY